MDSVDKKEAEQLIEDWKELVKVVTFLCNEFGMKQSFIAAKIGVSDTSFSHAVRGERPKRCKPTLDAILEAFPIGRSFTDLPIAKLAKSDKDDCASKRLDALESKLDRIISLLTI